MKYYIKSWFTLVELIVVITILAILSTIWFVNYSSYLTWVRDSNRIAQLKGISSALEIYRSNKRLPLPDDNIEIMSGDSIIWYQWYAGKNLLSLINYTWEWVDPKDDKYFSYYLTRNSRYYQLMAYLENEFNEKEIVNNSVFADDYEYRYPVVYGNKLWILTDLNNNPIQEVSDVYNNWKIDILNTEKSYRAYLSNQDIVEWTGSTLASFTPNSSCQRLFLLWNKQSWIYTINPTWTEVIEVYCDMVNAWGWWTLIATTADDNNDTWTYDNRSLLWNNSEVWSLKEMYKDFKSKAYHTLKFQDMMFIDKQEIWWSYHDINKEYDSTVAEWIPQTLDCAFWKWRDFSMNSWNVSKNLWQDDYQQDRMLFFSVYDNEAGCRPGVSDNHNAYWPSWWYSSNQGFSPDDPGAMWWGISDNDSYDGIYGYTEFWDARLWAKYARIDGVDLWKETIETDDW